MQEINKNYKGGSFVSGYRLSDTASRRTLREDSSAGRIPRNSSLELLFGQFRKQMSNRAIRGGRTLVLACEWQSSHVPFRREK